MNVAGIVLHPSAEAQLDAFLAAPSHAVLLSAPVGSGKTHIAESLAAALLDISDTDLGHEAYYRVVAPTKDSIGIEQIRELIGFFRLKVPGTAKIKRVAIIQDANLMGTEAQNALLKLLEEPPADSVLILTGSQPQRLLPTIRSRVQLLQLPGPDRETLQKHFTAGGHNDTQVAAAIARGGTNIAAVDRLLTDDPGTTSTIVDLVKEALGGGSYDRLLLVDSLTKHRQAAAEFVDTLATVAMAGLESAAAKATSIDRWRSALQAAHTAQDALERSGSVKLVLTDLMLAL